MLNLFYLSVFKDVRGSLDAGLSSGYYEVYLLISNFVNHSIKVVFTVKHYFCQICRKWSHKQSNRYFWRSHRQSGSFQSDSDYRLDSFLLGHTSITSFLTSTIIILTEQKPFYGNYRFTIMNWNSFGSICVKNLPLYR